jgi:hypothetical protein
MDQKIILVLGRLTVEIRPTPPVSTLRLD